jgi:hypothetical protein
MSRSPRNLKATREVNEVNFIIIRIQSRRLLWAEWRHLHVIRVVSLGDIVGLRGDFFHLMATICCQCPTPYLLGMFKAIRRAPIGCRHDRHPKRKSRTYWRWGEVHWCYNLQSLLLLGVPAGASIDPILATWLAIWCGRCRAALLRDARRVTREMGCFGIKKLH